MAGLLVGPQTEFGAMSESHPRGPLSTAPAGRALVLCVDDEVPVLESLRRLLRNEPYDLLTSNRPEEALEWIKSREVHVLIADQRMDGMLGTGLFKAVQAASPLTRRMMLTAYPDPEVMAEAINEAQIDRFMQKPWDDETLKMTIRSLLLGYSQGREAGAVVKDSLASHGAQTIPRARFEETPGYEKVKSLFGVAGSSGEDRRETIVLKNDIAILDPVPIAQGAFGQVYLGKILNPIGLLAERVIWKEESPKLLGLHSPIFQPPDKEADLGKPITDPLLKAQVYEAARRLWNAYLERRNRDRARANDEYVDLLNRIDPLLVEDRMIAVKVLHPARPESATVETRVMNELVQRFIKENDILRRLRHPHIVRRFGLVQDSRLGWCMILEYIEGVTLDEFQARYPGRRLPLDTALRMTRELVSALEYTQAQGIIHRDLKPQNIMVRTVDSRVVLMDFGIGKWIDDSETHPLTMPGNRLGTPRYMAPEQVIAGVAVTRATDIYQLSTLLFELVTGHAAYEGMSLKDIMAGLGNARRGHPCYVRDLAPDVSSELEGLIEIGRDKDPEKRWTIREFREKLEGILSSEPPSAGPRRLPDSLEALDRELQVARRRKKEAQWEERLLETELHLVSVKSQIEEVRRLLRRGLHDEARQLFASLGKETVEGSPRYEALNTDLAELGREVELEVGTREVERLLGRAESEFLAGRYPEVGVDLDAIGERLRSMPKTAFPELRERYRRLQEPYDARHRSFVDLFKVLKKSLVEKLRDRLQVLRMSRQAVSLEVLKDLLRELQVGEQNLASTEMSKVGREAYESLRLELAEIRRVLEVLRDSGKG
jgi:serine/threonine protein kinase/DNA-binding NarL/FixJ family response regulator